MVVGDKLPNNLEVIGGEFHFLLGKRKQRREDKDDGEKSHGKLFNVVI